MLAVVSSALLAAGCGTGSRPQATVGGKAVEGNAGPVQVSKPGHAPSKIPAGGCFPDPGACGYPDPAAHNVGPADSCDSYRRSPGTITSFDGQIIQNTTFTGQVLVESNNVTIRNVCVLMDGHGRLDGTSGIAIQSGSGTVIENTRIAGLNTSDHSLDWGVVNTGGKPATLTHDYLYNCGECIHDGPWNVDDTYAIANGMQGTAEHIETIYCDAGARYTDTIDARHDVLLNPFSYVGVLFCNTNNGAGGACLNHVTLTDSLLAGGGFVLYPCGNATSAGSSRIEISNNRIARCLTGPLRFNSDAGGTACAGSLSHDVGAGADSHGYWPKGGYYGVQSAGYCPPTPGQVWNRNVWDDNGAPIAC